VWGPFSRRKRGPRRLFHRRGRGRSAGGITGRSLPASACGVPLPTGPCRRRSHGRSTRGARGAHRGDSSAGPRPGRESPVHVFGARVMRTPMATVRRLVLACCLVSGVVLAGTYASIRTGTRRRQAGPVPAGPLSQLTFPETVWPHDQANPDGRVDFEWRRPGRHVFPFRNAGNRPVRVRLHSTGCGCTRVELGLGPGAPGGRPEDAPSNPAPGGRDRVVNRPRTERSPSMLFNWWPRLVQTPGNASPGRAPGGALRPVRRVRPGFESLEDRTHLNGRPAVRAYWL
jgi:hypothetical protein